MMLRQVFPSRTLAFYTAKMFLVRTFAFLAGLALILMTLDLLGESGRILAVPGNGEAELWKYVSIRMPQIISLFLPFSVLLATLLTFMTLNQNSEITIFKAAGISAHQILAPLMLSGLLIAVLNFAFNERFLTRANAEYDRWKAAEYRPLPPENKTGREVWVRAGDDLWHASGVEGEGAHTLLRDVTELRRRNLAGLSGRALEVGAGTGTNFALYPPEVTAVVALEPEDALRAEASAVADARVEVRPERLDEYVADEPFDAVVFSLVLCSLPDPEGAVRQVRGVLRPDGELRFLEHVAAHRLVHRHGQGLGRHGQRVGEQAQRPEGQAGGDHGPGREGGKACIHGGSL